MRWNTEQVEFLTKYYPKYGGRYCARKLGFSTRRVNNKTKKLKLRLLFSFEEKVCKKCSEPKNLSLFPKRRKDSSKSSSWCFECYKKNTRKNYHKDIEKSRELSRNYFNKNLIKKKKDIKWVITRRLRSRLNSALDGKLKTQPTLQLLGCTVEKFQEHLNSKFQNGMSFDSHGKWHIDHIKPCSSFDLTKPDEQKICFHYTNLQPLWAKDNLEKGDKCLTQQ